MDLLKLLSPAYLFDAFPGSEFAFRWPVYGFFVLLIVLGFILPKLLKKRPQYKLEHEFFGGIPYRLRELAVLGLIFTFFRDQNVPYLGMRIWIILIGVAMFIYLVYVWRNYKRNFNVKLVFKQGEKEEDKYLPKKKKRK